MAGSLLHTALFSTLRLAFRLVPMSPRSRDRLRQRFLSRHPGLVPAGPIGLPATATGWRDVDHAAHRWLAYRPRHLATLPEPLPATVVAFYLPQFHPIPENDAWWGEGFTEWRNVARALPQFEGHAQPRLPTDLGYYDLRLPQIMRDQMRMAREHGIGAFCTYFYWFAGKTLLEAPLRQWLADPSMALPIALCWANENWSRRWDGREDNVLIAQAHSADDDEAFIAHVAPYLRDPRYLRVEGKPLLLVYRPGLLPEPAATAARWRRWCQENGIGEIHLTYVQSFDNVDPATIGFDAAVAFPPNNTTQKPVTASRRLLNPAYRGDIYDWRELAREAVETRDPAYVLYPAANPGWDNEPRRSGRGRAFVHATPRAFGRWVRHAVATARRRSPGSPLVFINAWNEWAEGAILEPDTRFGFAWLNAVRDALGAPPADETIHAIVHITTPGQLDALESALVPLGPGIRLVLTTTIEAEASLRKAVAARGLPAHIIGTQPGGRDVLPFLLALGEVLDRGGGLVLKWPAGQREDSLVADAKAIQQAFRADPRLGLISETGALVDGDSGDAESDLRMLLGLGGTGHAAMLQHGHAFWCRAEALEALVDAPVSLHDFNSPDAAAPLADRLENLFVAAVQHSGFRVSAVSDIGASQDSLE